MLLRTHHLLVPSARIKTANLAPARPPPILTATLPRVILIIGLFALLPGCAQQTLTVTSDPPGAVVILNDQEVGRTPFTRDFTWYGPYDVIIRRDGYETIKTCQDMRSPFYMQPPLDLFAEMAGTHDHHNWHFKMHPMATQPSEPALLARADQMHGILQSSDFTRAASQPTTRSTTKSSTRPSKHPATSPATAPTIAPAPTIP